MARLLTKPLSAHTAEPHSLMAPAPSVPTLLEPPLPRESKQLMQPLPKPAAAKVHAENMPMPLGTGARMEEHIAKELTYTFRTQPKRALTVLMPLVSEHSEDQPMMTMTGTLPTQRKITPPLASPHSSETCVWIQAPLS